MNITDDAKVTIDAKAGIITAFCDGPNGRATRVKIWPNKEAVEANEPASINIDFEGPANVIEWFHMNAVTAGRIAFLLAEKERRDKDGH